MSTPTRIIAPLLLAAALVATGCGDDDDTSATTATTAPSEEVVVEDVWARTSATGAENGAVYLTITSPVDDRLTGASVATDVAAETEVHETVEAAASTSMGTATTMAGSTEGGGMGEMTMRPVESIELPAGQAVELKPGGYHIMLMGLAKPLQTGDSFDVTLTLEQAGEVVVTAEVRES